MIQPKDIKHKALRLWTSKRLLRDWIEPAGLFPFRISTGRLSSRQISDEYAAVKTWVAGLERHAGEGYSIVYRQTNHRQLGPQKVPASVVLETRQTCLRLIGKQRQFEHFQVLTETTLATWPSLRPVFLRRPLDILALEMNWDKLLAVCRYFVDHSRPGLYLRQLDIPGIDSKFIERHRSILTDLLDALLPGMSCHGFQVESKWVVL